MRKPLKTTAKAEALEAIAQAGKLLETPDMGVRLRIGLVLEALAMAAERVMSIEELRRVRRKPKEDSL